MQFNYNKKIFNIYLKLFEVHRLQDRIFLFLKILR